MAVTTRRCIYWPKHSQQRIDDHCHSGSLLSVVLTSWCSASVDDARRMSKRVTPIWVASSDILYTYSDWLLAHLIVIMTRKSILSATSEIVHQATDLYLTPQTPQLNLF